VVSIEQGGESPPGKEDPVKEVGRALRDEVAGERREGSR